MFHRRLQLTNGLLSAHRHPFVWNAAIVSNELEELNQLRQQQHQHRPRSVSPPNADDLASKRHSDSERNRKLGLSPTGSSNNNEEPDESRPKPKIWSIADVATSSKSPRSSSSPTIDRPATISSGLQSWVSPPSVVDHVTPRQNSHQIYTHHHPSLRFGLHPHHAAPPPSSVPSNGLRCGPFSVAAHAQSVGALASHPGAAIAHHFAAAAAAHAAAIQRQKHQQMFQQQDRCGEMPLTMNSPTGDTPTTANDLSSSAAPTTLDSSSVSSISRRIAASSATISGGDSIPEERWRSPTRIMTSSSSSPDAKYQLATGNGCHDNESTLPG